MKTSDRTGASETITSDEMRALEQDAITSGQVTGLELMECAGQGVVEAIFEKWPALAKPRPELQNNGRAATFEGAGSDERVDPSRWRAAILCGPGNNGGDGFVIARLLAELNWNVVVHFAGTVEALPPDARTNHDLWAQQGPVVLTEVFDEDWEEGLREYPDQGMDPVIYVDAVFGIGLNRGITSDALRGMEEYHIAVLDGSISGAEEWPMQPHKIVSVDIPSGLCSKTGTILKSGKDNYGRCIHADMTVTFHAKKPGHVLADGPRICGDVVVKDIGL